MRRGRISRGLTGLAAGAVLGAAVLGTFALGSLLGLPNAAFSLFDWLARVLPGRVVIFGLETTLRALEALGLSIKDASKATEEALALTELFVASAVVGLVFFAVMRPVERSVARRRGAILGAAAGALMLLPVVLLGDESLGAVVLHALWVLLVFLAWGWALGALFAATCLPTPHEAAGPAEATPAEPGGPVEATSQAAGPVRAPAARTAPELEAVRMDRRHFIVRMGGLAATFVVLGAEVAEILRVAGGPSVAPLTRAPIAFPNAGASILPVPGTRPEYTSVADHYRVDINLSAPTIDAADWRLRISGLVDTPLELTLDQLRALYPARDQFITLECISNPIGGPLIGTTLWSGPSFRDVLATARPKPGARYAQVLAEDGFDESVSLQKIRSDARVILAYDWNGEALTAEHGFPLRVYVPDLYGMKQPKWITEIVLVPDFVPGYWVKRGWSKEAVRRTTSVIDTVATSEPERRGGTTYVPVGGIADAGARGISRVEVQVDDGPWSAAELRPPLGDLTWVLWRYEWPWREGEHTFAVRAYDGAGVLQTTERQPTYPSGATGVHTKAANLLTP